MVLALTISLLTGLRIAVDDETAVLAPLVSSVLPQGSVTWLHVISATVLSLVAVAYIVFLWRAHLASRLAVSSGAIASRDSGTRWYAINRVLYWVVFALLIGAALTGCLMYFAPGVLPERAVAATHQFIAWAILGYVVVHVVAQIAFRWLARTSQNRQSARRLWRRRACRHGGVGGCGRGSALSAR